jgi:hypothetical protein
MPTQLRAPLTVASESARNLCRLLSNRVKTSSPGLLDLLEETADAIEGCPDFSPAEMGYYRNRLASCRKQLRKGEWGAARYELNELSRKLMQASS